jgi:hypothetical protein
MGDMGRKGLGLMQVHAVTAFGVRTQARGGFFRMCMVRRGKSKWSSLVPESEQKNPRSSQPFFADIEVIAAPQQKTSGCKVIV